AFLLSASAYLSRYSGSRTQGRNATPADVGTNCRACPGCARPSSVVSMSDVEFASSLRLVLSGWSHLRVWGAAARRALSPLSSWQPRCEALSTGQIKARLDHSFQMRAGANRLAPTRQQT